MPSLDSIGKSLKFPLEIDSNGAAVLTEGTVTIEQSIKNILSWDAPRFFLTPFVSRVHEVLEEPNIGVSHMLIRTYTIEAINRWESRIDLLSVEVSASDETSVSIQIIYRVKETQLEQTLVYAFYKN